MNNSVSPLCFSIWVQCPAHTQTFPWGPRGPSQSTSQIGLGWTSAKHQSNDIYFLLCYLTIVNSKIYGTSISLYLTRFIWNSSWNKQKGNLLDEARMINVNKSSHQKLAIKTIHDPSMSRNEVTKILFKKLKNGSKEIIYRMHTYTSVRLHVLLQFAL